MEELAIFERIQIYQRDRSCVYDSGENTTSAADVLQELHVWGVESGRERDVEGGGKET